MIILYNLKYLFIIIYNDIFIFIKINATFFQLYYKISKIYIKKLIESKYVWIHFSYLK